MRTNMRALAVCTIVIFTLFLISSSSGEEKAKKVCFLSSFRFYRLEASYYSCDLHLTDSLGTKDYQQSLFRRRNRWTARFYKLTLLLSNWAIIAGRIVMGLYGGTVIHSFFFELFSFFTKVTIAFTWGFFHSSNSSICTGTKDSWEL